MDWEMPQQIRGGEFVHGDRFPNSAPPASWSHLMPASTVFISRALFFETQSHAIKHDYFMQHSSVDAHSSKYPRFLDTAQLGRPGRKEHAQHSETGRPPPNTEEEGAAKLQ